MVHEEVRKSRMWMIILQLPRSLEPKHRYSNISEISITLQVSSSSTKVYKEKKTGEKRAARITELFYVTMAAKAKTSSTTYGHVVLTTSSSQLSAQLRSQLCT
jgi:hypothetical protein